MFRLDFTGRTSDFYSVEGNFQSSNAQYIFVKVTIKLTCCIYIIYTGDISNRQRCTNLTWWAKVEYITLVHGAYMELLHIGICTSLKSEENFTVAICLCAALDTVNTS